MSIDLRVQPQSLWPHVAVILIGGLLAVVLIVFILWLRPQYDPVAVVGAVGAAIGIATTQFIAIIKSLQHDEQSRQIGQNVVGGIDVVAEKIAQAPVVAIADRRSLETPLPVKIVTETPQAGVVLEEKK